MKLRNSNAMPLSRSISSVMAVVLVGLSLAACSGTAPTPEKSVSSSASAIADLELIEPGKLSVAMLTDQRPTSFLDSNKPSGFAVELMDEIAKRIGIDVDYRTSTIPATLSSLAANQFDTAAFGLIASPERLKILDFSDPWMYGYFGLMVNGKSKATGLDSFKGKIVGVETGSFQEQLILDNYPDITPRSYPTTVAMVTGLAGNQVDAILIGNSNIDASIAQYPALEVIGTVPLQYPNAFPVQKDHPKLLAAINDALEELMDDGTYIKLFDKWQKGTPFPNTLFETYPSLEKQLASK